MVSDFMSHCLHFYVFVCCFYQFQQLYCVNKFFRFPFSCNAFYFSLGLHLLQDSFSSLILKIVVKGCNCYSVFPIDESVL